MNVKEPPLGIMPLYIAIDDFATTRVKELMDAMGRVVNEADMTKEENVQSLNKYAIEIIAMSKWAHEARELSKKKTKLSRTNLDVLVEKIAELPSAFHSINPFITLISNMFMQSGLDDIRHEDSLKINYYLNTKSEKP